MSVLKIRAALETALAAMSPALATAWENTAYTPSADAPYQRVSMLFEPPVNTEYGRSFQQGGMFVVALCWPQGAGMADLSARIELLRATFPRGAAFTADGLTTQVARTPLVLAAILEGDRYVVPVQVPFLATITS
uniref:phage tail terminator-like protein n=1 Tax=uncultured Caulobacter sp. TaxID=158749 RepID=UPI0025FEA945|nr:phage tail terminator-like protein [uncultured Caulobacter sp.]